jgi:hypothetical protein
MGLERAGDERASLYRERWDHAVNATVLVVSCLTAFGDRVMPSALYTAARQGINRQNVFGGLRGLHLCSSLLLAFWFMH